MGAVFPLEEPIPAFVTIRPCRIGVVASNGRARQNRFADCRRSVHGGLSFADCRGLSIRGVRRTEPLLHHRNATSSTLLRPDLERLSGVPSSEDST